MDDGSIDVQPREDAWLVALRGELDAGDVPAFNRALAPIVDDARDGVIVDLSAARMIDSTMLGALVGWHSHARQQGRRPVVFVASGESPAARLLGVVMGSEAPIYGDVDEAIGAIAG
jgi:anti-anti-sigma factor